MGKIEHAHVFKALSEKHQVSGSKAVVDHRRDLGAADLAVQAFTVCGSVALPHRCGRLGCAALPPRDV